MKLRTKFTIITITIIILLGSTIALFINSTLSSLIYEDTRSRGLLLAENIAEESIPLIQNGDHSALDQIARDETGFGVAYTIITDPFSRVLASNIIAGTPIRELNSKTVRKSQNFLTGDSIAVFDTSQGTVYDVAYPISGHLGTVRIGLSDKLLEEQVSRSSSRVLAIILFSSVIATIATLASTTYLLRPIKNLYGAAHELSMGNFNAHVDIKTNDELAELASVFNRTTEALSKLDLDRKQIDSAKTRFLSITSHELRSPMTPMKAQLQMLEQGYYGKLTEKQRQSVDVILRNADRLDRIIADFLEISRIEAARLKFVFKKTDLAAMVKEVVHYMNGFMPEKKITFTMKLGKLPVIDCDPDRVSQVVRNLLSNAVKFSKNGNTVDITARLEEDHILMSVADHGIGIAPKDQLKLFEPFFQAEQTIYRERAGVGLGLAICRGIVLSQNGKIWLESALGKGTKFSFTLPLKPVDEIKPIRVLFSSKDNVEKKLADLFREMLGPIGESEFADLKEQLTKEHVHAYLHELRRKGIINSSIETEFKHKVDHAFLMADGHEHPENKK